MTVSSSLAQHLHDVGFANHGSPLQLRVGGELDDQPCACEPQLRHSNSKTTVCLSTIVSCESKPRHRRQRSGPFVMDAVAGSIGRFPSFGTVAMAFRMALSSMSPEVS